MAKQTLYWSRQGEIACERHAPSRVDPRFDGEGWQQIPAVAGRRITYQCQHCGLGSIQHQYRAPKTPLILNVDDRPAMLYARDRILRQHGFTVANAETGRSALDVARQLQPSLILLDVHLPDLDGRHVCQQVKADATLAHIPVLLISATLSSPEPAETLRAIKASGFIAEPVEPEVLAGIIRQVLDGSSLTL
jgi:CheY-like chemotaxis protein